MKIFTVLVFLITSFGLGAQDEAGGQEEGQSLVVSGSLGLESKYGTVLEPLSLVFEGDHRFKQQAMEFSLKHRLDVGIQGAAIPNSLIYEAYGLIRPWEGGDFYLGKKRLSLGLGNTVTIADTYNPIVGFFDQKTGAIGFQGVVSFSSDFGLSLGVSLDRAFSKGTMDRELIDYGLIFSGLWDKLQVQASMVYGYGKTFLPGIGLTYDLGGVVVTAEGAAEFLPQNPYPANLSYSVPSEWTSPRASGSVGLRYTYTGDPIALTLSQEYLFWGQGWTEAEIDQWDALGPPLAGLIPSPRPLRSQHYTFSKLVLGWDEIFSYSVSAFGSPVENCWLINQSLAWTWKDNLEVALSLLLARGPDGTEWYRIPGNGGTENQFTAAVRVHF